MLARPGFDVTRHAVSSLQNGEFGWVQSVTFIFSGILSILCAWGVRRYLHGSRGGTWGPLLVGTFGIGMILAGFCAPDPAFGFPAGTPDGAPEAMSMSGGLHSLGFFGAFMALIAGCFVLSRHFGRATPRWRRSCLVVGTTTPLLIVLCSWHCSVSRDIGHLLLLGRDDLIHVALERRLAAQDGSSTGFRSAAVSPASCMQPRAITTSHLLSVIRADS